MLRKGYILSLMVSFISTLFLTSCSFNNKNVKDPQNSNSFKTVMITDIGGVNDQSFNQSAWEGLKELKNELKEKIDVSYVEPKQTMDYTLLLDKLADGDYNLIYAIGYALCDSMYDVSTLNLDKNFVMVDYDFGKDTPNNVTCVMFYSQEAAFLVGYIAGKTTKTNKVGFLGGIRGYIIDQFEYGYKAGVNFAEKELNKKIEITTQYAESFTDVAIGKAIGTKMYNSGCDVVFHAAGPVGFGLIEAAKEHGTYAIGVDRDQSDIDPDHVLTSAVKNVGKAVSLVCKSYLNGEKIAGKTLTYGAKEGCVGIPDNCRLMGKKTYDAALELLKKIKDGKISIKGKEIIIPYSKDTYQEYLCDT